MRLVASTFLISCITAQYTDFPMTPWEMTQQPWIGGEDVEMTAVSLRKAKRILNEGGIAYVRGSLGGIRRYASAKQGPEERERTSTEGAALSVAVDMSTIIDGELHLDPLASVEYRKKLFVTRSCLVRDEFPTVFAFQVPHHHHHPPTHPTPSLR